MPQAILGGIGAGAGIADAFSSGAPKMKKFSSLAGNQQDIDAYLHNFFTGRSLSSGKMGVISQGATPYNGPLAADLTPALNNIATQLKNYDWNAGNQQSMDALSKALRNTPSLKLSTLDRDAKSSMMQGSQIPSYNAPSMNAPQYNSPTMKGVGNVNAPLQKALENYVAPSMQGVKDYNAPTYSTPTALKSTFNFNPSKVSTYLNGQYTQDYFQKSVVDPAMRNFDRNIDPRLRDSFAAAGAGFSSRRDYARAQALTDTNVQMNAQLADAVRQDEQLRAQMDLTAQQFNNQMGYQTASTKADDQYRAALANSQNQLATNQLNSNNILQTNQLNSSNALQAQMANLQSRLNTNQLNSANTLAVQGANQQSQLATNTLNTQNAMNTQQANLQAALNTNSLNANSLLTAGQANMQSRLATNSLNSNNIMSAFQTNAGIQQAYDQMKIGLTESAANRQLQASAQQQSILSNQLQRLAMGNQIGAPQQELRQQLVQNQYADAQRMMKENNPYLQMMYNYIGQPHLAGIPYQSPTWVDKFTNIMNGWNTGASFGLMGNKSAGAGAASLGLG